MPVPFLNILRRDHILSTHQFFDFKLSDSREILTPNKFLLLVKLTSLSFFLHISNWKVLLPFVFVIFLFSAAFFTKKDITFAVNIWVFPGKSCFTALSLLPNNHYFQPRLRDRVYFLHDNKIYASRKRTYNMAPRLVAYVICFVLFFFYEGFAVLIASFVCSEELHKWILQRHQGKLHDRDQELG